MTVEDYIASGNLEAYCLGNLTAAEEAELWEFCRLFPKVRQELHAVEQSLEKLAEALAVIPPGRNKMRLLARLNELPVIDETTDHTDWLAAFMGLIPAQPADDLVFHPLTTRPELSQTLVYSRLSIPEETHDDLMESFFILEGTCTCTVSGVQHHLSPGGFLEIPLHVPHDIRLTSPHVLAILQQQPVK